MLFMPFQVLGVWLRGLLAAALLAAGVYLLVQWYHHRYVPVHEPADNAGRSGEDPPPTSPEGGEERVRLAPWRFGLNRPTAYLLGGVALLAWSLGGGWAVPRLLRRGGGGDAPDAGPAGAVQRLRRPDGSELHVEALGPADGPVLVLTHGWSLDAQEWCYAKRELAQRHRLLVWDLPGLGRSTRPADGDWSLERMARDLDAVVALAGGRPVVLVGHSIGGMIALTYCRLFPEALGERVRGLVIGQSTYTNPVKTAAQARLYTALQKPVLEPLCHVMVWLSPVVWVLNCLAYLNGSAHRSTRRSAFSGREGRGQLDYLTRYYLRSSPAVVARGFLAMFRYDATATLTAIPVPALVVAGDRDSSCQPGASAFMAQTIPNGRLLTLGDAQHAGLFEHHGTFHAAVAAFASACLAEEGARGEPRR